MALLVHEVFLDLPARLANEARSDRVARVVLQVLRANAVLLVDVGCLGLMDLQDQRVMNILFLNLIVFCFKSSNNKYIYSILCRPNR